MNYRLIFAAVISILFTSCVSQDIKTTSSYGNHLVSVDEKDAEITVIVEYEIPDVVKDADEFYFKTKMIMAYCAEYPDGTIETYELITHEGGCVEIKFLTPFGKHKHRDGFPEWNGSFLRAIPTGDGIKILLKINWGGGRVPGEIEKNFFVAWRDLPKVIEDKSAKINIKLKRRNDLNQTASGSPAPQAS